CRGASSTCVPDEQVPHGIGDAVAIDTDLPTQVALIADDAHILVWNAKPLEQLRAGFDLERALRDGASESSDNSILFYRHDPACLVRSGANRFTIERLQRMHAQYSSLDVLIRQLISRRQSFADDTAGRDERDVAAFSQHACLAELEWRLERLAERLRGTFLAKVARTFDGDQRVHGGLRLEVAARGADAHVGQRPHDAQVLGRMVRHPELPVAEPAADAHDV